MTVTALPIGPKPNAELMEFLEKTLEAVKDGSIQAGFFAGVFFDGSSYSGFSPNGRLFELIGATTAAQYRLMVLNVEIER